MQTVLKIFPVQASTSLHLHYPHEELKHYVPADKQEKPHLRLQTFYAFSSSRKSGKYLWIIPSCEKFIVSIDKTYLG